MEFSASPPPSIPSPPETSGTAPIPPAFQKIMMIYQKMLDASVPHLVFRWSFAGILLFLYFLRTIYLQGWYIITYALGIYLLNIFIAFLTPRFDPSADMLDSEEGDGDGPSLPTKNDQEFRPFIRRLPEFKFWHRFVKATSLAFFCTFFEMCNVPVFWPILVLYFFLLFFLTMKRQVKHMIKYKYVPWTFGKKKYPGKSTRGKVSTW